MRVIVLVMLLAATACSGPSVPTPGGPVFAFNPGKWTATPADLTVPARVRQ